MGVTGAVPQHRQGEVGRSQALSEIGFFRGICGRFSALLSLRDELPTASAGRFVASADRPPPWTTLRCIGTSSGLELPGEALRLQRPRTGVVVQEWATKVPIAICWYGA